MNVSDVKVTDEDGYLSCSKTIKANNNTVKERIWITVKLTIKNRVVKVDVEPNATSWTYSRSSRLHVQMWNAVVNGWTWSPRISPTVWRWMSLLLWQPGVMRQSLCPGTPGISPTMCGVAWMMLTVRSLCLVQLRGTVHDSGHVLHAHTDKDV